MQGSTNDIPAGLGYEDMSLALREINFRLDGRIAGNRLVLRLHFQFLSTMGPSRPRSLRALAFGSRRNSSPGARSPSPTFSETTNASALNFGDGTKVITRADLKASLQAYEQVRIPSIILLIIA